MNSERLYDINDVCKMLGTTSRTLRFYEEKGIIQSTEKKFSPRRHYTYAQIGQIKTVLALRSLGLTVKSIAEMQRGSKSLKCALRERRAEIIASITGKMNDIRILNDALTFIDEGRDPVKTDIRENLCTPSGRHADIARECSVAVVENDPDILYRYFSEELTACMPADVYLSVRQDVLSVLGCFEAYEELWSYTDRPDIIYQNIRYSKLGLTLKLVFREDRVEGFWMTYYEL